MVKSTETRLTVLETEHKEILKKLDELPTFIKTQMDTQYSQMQSLVNNNLQLYQGRQEHTIDELKRANKRLEKIDEAQSSNNERFHVIEKKFLKFDNQKLNCSRFSEVQTENENRFKKLEEHDNRSDWTWKSYAKLGGLIIGAVSLLKAFEYLIGNFI